MNRTPISDWIRGNVLGFVAIFIALTGSAYAIDGPLPGQDQVGSADIINGEVATPDLGADAVTSGKIEAGQVTSTDLRASSVTGAKVADGSLAGADIAPDSLGAAQVDEASLDSSVLQHRLATGCAAGSAIRDVDAAGNVTCEGVGGGGSPTGPAGGSLTGTYPNPSIAANAVGSSAIAANAVGSDEIASSAVGTSEIASGAVVNGSIAPGAVSGNRVLDDSLGGEDIFDGSLRGADVGNGSLTGSDIADTDSLGDPEINQSSLDMAVGKTTHDGGFCIGTTFDGGTCATLSLTLPRSEHVMLIATGEYVVDQFDDPQQPEDPGNTALMDCHLEADGTSVGTPITVGEKQTSFGATPVHDLTFPGNFVLTGITSTLSAGTHTVILNCFKDDGDIDASDARITAVTLD